MQIENNFEKPFNNDDINEKAFETTPFENVVQTSKKYRIKVLCDYSVNVKEYYFTNFVERQVLNNENKRIIEVIELNDKYLEEDELLFETEGYLSVYNNNIIDRIDSIFSPYIKECLKRYEAENIKKAYFQDKVSGLLSKQWNNKLRVFYRLGDDGDSIEILLLDPNHLVATSHYKNDYPKYKNYSVDIKNLVEKRKQLWK